MGIRTSEGQVGGYAYDEAHAYEAFRNPSISRCDAIHFLPAKSGIPNPVRARLGCTRMRLTLGARWADARSGSEMCGRALALRSVRVNVEGSRMDTFPSFSSFKSKPETEPLMQTQVLGHQVRCNALRCSHRATVSGYLTHFPLGQYELAALFNFDIRVST